ncbi:uncharacterized protein Tco025E_01995 [Trypanosoma conorhini]|uniref:Right handed beta helix domain-containing protein n=1 Tax=Trypanosoma conorhini TaxID=83891 RepID=A0A3R7N5L3_9TRYP|nr:uncharacterized protein Tco025E_01995 [Trypanosoma conorhini]RNF25784.1 hypothetical protein Tco025E_01995 [Trypanosoma conorhini]
MGRGSKEAGKGASGESSLLQAELTAFMREASRWSATEVTSDTLLPALQQLPPGEPSSFFASGYLRCPSIENGASCLISATNHMKHAAALAKADAGDDGHGKKGGGSSRLIFDQPLKITSCAPIGFHGVWFMDRVELVGKGPAFFSHCVFGASVGFDAAVGSPMSSGFASVHLALDGICTFSKCEFRHRCGTGGAVGSHEVPALRALGRTRVQLANCTFTGPGVESTALALSGNAALEAECTSVVCCGGHGLIVGGNSNASLSRCFFEQNGAGVWVKDKGTLEIHGSSLKLARQGRSVLLLSEHGRCLAQDCLFLGCASASLEAIGRCIVVELDTSYLSLRSCELFWSDAENLVECEELTKVSDIAFSSSVCEATKDLGVCHVLLGERSAMTMSRCVLGLPLAEQPASQSPVVGVLLRSAPRRDFMPLYAVENTVVYGRCMGGDGVPRATAPAGCTTTPCWGLVLPGAADTNKDAERWQLARMWLTENSFLESDEAPLRDLSRAFTSFETYCSVTGTSPSAPDVEDDWSLDGATPVSSPCSLTTTKCFVDPLLEERRRSGAGAVHPPQRTWPTLLLPEDAILSTNLPLDVSPPERESTCPRQTPQKKIPTPIDEGSSDSTSLTSYDDVETENTDSAVANGTPVGLNRFMEASAEDTDKDENEPCLIDEPPHVCNAEAHLKRSMESKKWMHTKHIPELRTFSPIDIGDGDGTATDATPTPTSSVSLPKRKRSPANAKGPRKPQSHTLRNGSSRRQVWGEHQTMKASSGVEVVSHRIRHNLFISPHYPSTARAQKAQTLEANTSLPVTANFVVSASQPRSSTSPESLASARELPAKQLGGNVKGSSTELWSWEVPKPQNLPAERLGLHPEPEAQEEASRNPGTEKEEEAETTKARQQGVESTLDSTVEVEAPMGDATGRSAPPPGLAAQVRPPSSQPTPGRSPRASRLRRGKLRSKSLRHDNEFASKLSKAHPLSGRAEESQGARRGGEQPAHAEEGQAQAQESSGTVDRNGAPAACVAGSALNYAAQQGQGAKSHRCRSFRRGVATLRSASVSPRTSPRFLQRSLTKRRGV